MGKNPFCYHVKLVGGKELANCSPRAAGSSGARGGAACGVPCVPRALSLLLIHHNVANEAGARHRFARGLVKRTRRTHTARNEGLMAIGPLTFYTPAER